MPLPVYFSLHSGGSYLMFYENSFRANISFGNGDSYDAIPQMNDNVDQVVKAEFEGGQLRYYIILGPPEHVLDRFAELTGSPAMPPIWSLGYHQSRWGYKDETDIREVAGGFKAHNMPISAIHLDIDYLDGYRVFTVNEERFPDLPSLAEELIEQGIRLVTIIDPGVKKDPEYFLYNEGIEGGYFCAQPDGRPTIGLVWPGWSAFPDFTDPKVRLWWSKQYAKMLDLGVAGIWHDMNEPASFAAWGNPTLPMSTRHTLEGKGGDHLQAHNLYGLLMNRSAYEGLRKLRPESRPWIVSRSGWVSSQRYAWKWTGDTETSWESLRMTISTMLGTGLSGQPYSGPDVGGFRGDPPAELFLRYFQLSAFLPFFRTHSAVGSKRREPWVYGEPYTSIIRQYLNLRYQLIPYLYTLAWNANQKGHPLVRPLFWGNVCDQDLWQVDDAFLLGDNLLVAPVMEEGASERTVRLPKNNWMNMQDDKIYKGPGSVTIPVSLEHIPVLVREGSLIPMMVGEELELHLYGSPNLPNSGDNLLIGQLYSDAGEGYGDWRLDSFYASYQTDELTITWESKGNFPFPYQNLRICNHGLDPKAIQVDGALTPTSEASISCSKFNTLQIKI
jgi:alpha-glucosidase